MGELRSDVVALEKSHNVRNLVQLGQDSYTAIHTGSSMVTGNDISILAEFLGNDVFDHYLIPA